MSAHLVTAETKEDGSTEFKTVQPTLSQQKQLEILREEFEKAFGKDQENRTLVQWRNLVSRYGIDFVCRTEKMTKGHVMKKMGY